MRKSILPLVLLMSVAGAAIADRPPSIDKVNGSIRTEEGRAYDSLETVNGSITLAVQVRANSVETVNGSISLNEGASAEGVETVNGSISLGASAQVGSAETVNGSVRLDRGATVRGDVETVNGAIRLEAASIGGNLETVNGDITLLDGSRIAGGITVEKPSTGWFNFGGNSRLPKVVIGPNSEVVGTMVFKRDVELFVHETARIGRVDGAEAKRYSGSAMP